MSASPHESNNDHENIEIPYVDSDVSEYAQVIGTFDSMRGQVLDAICEFVEEPITTHESSLITSIVTMTRAFRSCVDLIHEDGDSTEQHVTMVQQLIMGEQNERVQLVEMLLPGIDYTGHCFEEEGLHEILEDAYEDYDSIKKTKTELIELFSQNVDDGMEYLSHFVDYDGEFGEQDQREESLHKLGRHALDIVKISLGVAGGMMMAKYFSKKE